MSLKNSNDTIGNRTRDLSVCSVVPLPLRHHAPQQIMYSCILSKFGAQVQLCGRINSQYTKRFFFSSPEVRGVTYLHKTLKRIN